MPEEQIERSQPVEQGAEKKALSTPDAQAARNASAADVNEVQSTNPNKFESMTKLPTIKDGMSLESAQAEFESFGIEMGDNTTVTAAGVDAPAMKRNISVDPRPSYVEGLKAIGNDEEAQGKYSIEYMERKEREALAALQEKPTEQVLIASNITPAAPNLEQIQKYPEMQSDFINVRTAENFEYTGGLPTLVPSAEQLGLDQIWHGLDRLQHQVKHQFRGHIGETMKTIPNQTWSDAYSKFPQFKEAGLTEKQATELMQAIARNELFFYDLGDALDDKSVRETGKPMQYPFKDRPIGAATLGMSQVSIDGVKKFEGEFPSQMSQYSDREAEALLNPHEAPTMIAAVLAHNIQDYKVHYPINERTLAYSFNPDVPDGKSKKPPTDETLKESEHYANVMRQLAIIRGQLLPKPDEQ